jgi:tetratricopeptide (TPR) repeat protein
MRILLAFFALSLASFTSSGTSGCSNCTVYQGFIRGDSGMWKKGMDEARAAYSNDPSSCTLYTLTEAEYGYIGYLLGLGNKTGARPYIDDFEKNVGLLEAFPERKAEAEAFSVALLGYKMGLNPARAMTLGTKALKQLETALETGPDNPAVWIEKANSEAHMPAFVGGSKIKAAESFRRAIVLFESQEESLECNWRYLNTHVLLGKVLEQNGDYQGACDTYRKALLVAPAFLWVRDELLPAAERNIK